MSCGKVQEPFAIDQVFQIFPFFPYVKCRIWPFPHTAHDKDTRKTAFFTLFILSRASDNTTSENIGGGTDAWAVPHLKFWEIVPPVPPRSPPLRITLKCFLKIMGCPFLGSEVDGNGRKGAWWRGEMSLFIGDVLNGCSPIIMSSYHNYKEARIGLRLNKIIKAYKSAQLTSKNKWSNRLYEHDNLAGFVAYSHERYSVTNNVNFLVSVALNRVLCCFSLVNIL